MRLRRFRVPRARPERHSYAIGGVVLVTMLGIASISLATGQTFGALTAKVTNSTDTGGTRTFFTCESAETTGLSQSSNTYFAWKMSSSSTTITSGTTQASLGSGTSGTWYGTVGGNNASVGCLRDVQSGTVPAKSASFNGGTTPDCLISSSAANSTTTPAPTTFSLEAWFSTSLPSGTTYNGRIIGLENSNTAANNGGNYDRQIYLDKDGYLVFAIYRASPSNGLQYSIATSYAPASAGNGKFNDGSWHHVVGTANTSGGTTQMNLYADGKFISGTSFTSIDQWLVSGSTYTVGYWKVGCGTLGPWPDSALASSATGNTMTTATGASGISGQTTTPSLYVSKPTYFTGNLQFVAAYTKVFTAAEVAEHYLAGAP